MSEYKHFTVQQFEDVSVLLLVDPKLFDTLIVTELQDELLDFIDTRNPSKVLVNFGNVSHCSTAVINSLLRSKKRLVGINGKLKLCCLRETIREAYKMLNLDGTVFEIHNTQADGINSY